MAENTQSYSYDGKKSINLVKWKIRKGSQLSQTVIFHYKHESGACDEKEPILKFKSTIGGTVSEIVASEGDTIHPGTELLKFQPCTHSVIMKDLCAECGMDLRHLDKDNFEKLTAATTFSMVHIVPELKVSLEQAEKLGRDDEDRLMKNKKLVLLVDLDQTLIHTTNDDVPKELPDVHHFQLYGPNSPWYHTKLRPGTKTFLENISNFYELHICTFGARLYAHKIANILDKSGKLFSHRILSRDECFDATSKTGNLKALFPRGDGMVCIIDDREDVWNFAPNVIRVKPYNYFQNTGDINAPPNNAIKETKQVESATPLQCKSAPGASEESTISETKVCLDQAVDKQNRSQLEDSAKDLTTNIEKKGDNVDKLVEKHEAALKKGENSEKAMDTYWDAHHADDYLLFLEEILMSVHKTYFEMYDKMKKDKQKGIPDLKMVVPYVRRKVLNKCRIVFSSIIPTNCVPPESHYLWTLAESLGAHVSRELELEKNELRTTHVVACKDGTVKVNLARRQKDIYIVSLDWLLCCADRWEHADERLFPIANTDRHNLNSSKSAKARAKTFSSIKRKRNTEETKDNFSERIFVEAGLSLSKEDIDDMDKEIDEACSDESNSAESDDSSSSSSIESLSSGDYPKGWKKRHRKDVTMQDNEAAETSDAETIGSVDEEMAEAVRQEFGSY